MMVNEQWTRWFDGTIAGTIEIVRALEKATRDFPDLLKEKYKFSLTYSVS